jgi:hypothetical protein
MIAPEDCTTFAAIALAFLTDIMGGRPEKRDTR